MSSPFQKHSPRRSWQILFSLAVVAALIAGCNPLAAAFKPTPTATNTATPEPTFTPTLEPTATSTPTPTATNTPTATPDHKATAQAKAQAQVDAAMEAILDDLEEYKVNPDEGYLGWLGEKPVSMVVDQYMEMEANPIDVGEVSDFVFQSDVTWDSTSGLAGCGLIFRSEEDLYEGAQYRLMLMRLSGAPAWDIEYTRYGQWQATITERVQFSNAINDEPDSTNKLAIVVKGDIMSVYINGTRARTINYSKLTEGETAFLTWQESGTTTCTFSNSWMWIYGEKPSGFGVGGLSG